MPTELDQNGNVIPKPRRHKRKRKRKRGRRGGRKHNNAFNKTRTQSKIMYTDPAVHYSLAALSPMDEVKGASPGPPIGIGRDVVNLALSTSTSIAHKAFSTVSRLHNVWMVVPNLRYPLWQLHNYEVNSKWYGEWRAVNVTFPDQDTIREESAELKVWQTQLKMDLTSVPLNTSGSIWSCRVPLTRGPEAGLSSTRAEEFVLPHIKLGLTNFDGTASDQDAIYNACMNLNSFVSRAAAEGLWANLLQPHYAHSVMPEVTALYRDDNDETIKLVAKLTDGTAFAGDMDAFAEESIGIIFGFRDVAGTNSPVCRATLYERLEIMPPPGSILALVAEPAPPHNEEACDYVAQLAEAMTSSYPVADNDFGGIFKKVIHAVAGTVKRALPAISPLLSMIPGVGKVAGTLAAGIGMPLADAVEHLTR